MRAVRARRRVLIEMLEQGSPQIKPPAGAFLFRQHSRIHHVRAEGVRRAGFVLI
jgi:hypothetical protein